MIDTEENYDLMANNWHAIEDFTTKSDYYKCELSMIESEIKKLDIVGKDILDCACGDGRFTRMLADWGANKVIGLDLSNELIKIANNITFNNDNDKYDKTKIEYYQHDLNKPLPPEYVGKFDIVINVHLLNYAENIEMVNNFYVNMRNALKSSNGKIFTLMENHDHSPLDYQKHLKYGWIKQIDAKDLYDFYINGFNKDGIRIKYTGFIPTLHNMTEWTYSKQTHENALNKAGFYNVNWITFDCDNKLYDVYKKADIRHFVEDYYKYQTNIAFTATTFEQTCQL